MPKRIYTDEDRAAVYVALQVNKGAVAQTSRDTGFPQQTIRDWKRDWETNGPPEFVGDQLEEAADQFVKKAEHIRDLLLEKYLLALETGLVKPDKMPIHIGIFFDKIQLARGLATQRTEQLALPTAEQSREIAMALVGAAKGALDAMHERNQDIIDVEAVEEQPKALTKGKTDGSP